MKPYPRILKYATRYKKYILISVGLSVLFSIFSGLSIYLTIPLLKTLFISGNSVTDAVPAGNFIRNSMYEFEKFILSGGKENALFLTCALILIAYLLKNITGFFQSLYMQKVEKSVMRDVRYEMYEKVNSFSLRYFTSERTGNLISRMTNDVNVIQGGLSAVFFNLFREPLLIIIYLVLALSISWKMTLIALVVFPVTVLVVAKIGSSLRRRSQRMQNKNSEILSVITETIYASKIIRAFNAQNFLNRLFRKESDELYTLTMKNVKASELAQPITEFLTILAGVSIIWFGGRDILVTNTLSAEDFLGFLFIIFQLVVPIKNLSGVNNSIQQSSVSAERIFEIIDYPLEITESKDALEKNSFDKSIELRNVCFEYDVNKPVIKNVSFKIEKSQVIALVGPSGSGKSTLADLIARFYDVTSGNILIDDMDIKNISIKSLRNLIGIVQQETILFNDTIRNNIIFGMENVSEEKLIEICRSANAYDFILKTENGLDTVIGERGLKLSGGQRQRISIARTLLRNPAILILDEATSSLDSQSEITVQNAIEKLMTGRTSIVIAHRLSTVRNADIIFVLEKGGIAESGNHEELLQKKGLYRQLYDTQNIQI
ncbi:MAG: ABC transporter ATP-binding protein [Ignavibacteria bacterium]|nr:ABC transporter ATP-binding protein [Ignavibacteria bacterium]